MRKNTSKSTEQYAPRKRYNAEVHDIAWYQNNVPCRQACPVKTDSGRYVQLIAENRFKEAFMVARSPNPLASICGRVCAAPCEDACRRGVIDTPVAIRPLKRFVCEKYGSESPKSDTFLKLMEDTIDLGAHRQWHLPTLSFEKPIEGERKIAIIGSGPAGLACAHDLILRGFKVTIFEASDVLGGMMRLGIPEYRLPRGVIDQEIAAIQFLGAHFDTRKKLGENFDLRDLKKQGYEAVFISIGAFQGGALDIPGADKDGVIKAVDYLLNVNRGYKVNLGKKVLVIGGGSVALDAARTAIREFYSPMEEIDIAAKAGDMHIAIDVARHAVRGGAIEVHVASLESMEELPSAKTVQGREELQSAGEEGIVFHPALGPHKITGNGTVDGIELIECTQVFDENGRFNPKYNKANKTKLEVDSIILAIGQKPDLSFIGENDKIEQTAYGTIKINPETLATTAPGIFAGGDVAFGPRILIEAVENGKRAAQSIINYIDKREHKTHLTVTINKIPTEQYSMPESYELYTRQHPPNIPIDRRTGISEVELVYDDQEAIEQAKRCLACHVETIYDPELCVLCGRCVDICPEDCLALVLFDDVEIEKLDSVLETQGLQTDVTNNKPLSVMLKDHERCIRCGLCAVRCPTEAMTMERFTFDETII